MRVFWSNMNQLKVLFLALLLLISSLFFLLTQDLFRPVVKKGPSPMTVTSEAQKLKLSQREDVNKIAEIQRNSEMVAESYSKMTHASLNRKEKLLTVQPIAKITASVRRPQSISALGNAKEVTHIEFLKVHKAASSTVQSIILRFGLKRNLSFAIPTPTHYVSQRKYFFSDFLPPLPKRMNEQEHVNTDKENNYHKYDILSHHMVFNQRKVSQLLHNDSFYVAIVRGPFDLFLSAAYYYKFAIKYPYLVRLRNETFITDLIRNPELYEATSMAESMTYNPMAYDFGLDFHTLKQAENISDERFDDFLEEIADSFQLVMVVEYFEESLVLLKRYLNWSLCDILYTRINTFSSPVETNTYRDFRMSAKDIKVFRKRNKFDYRLYELFKDRLEVQISKEEHFADEVTHFKAILQDVQIFCLNSSTEELKARETPSLAKSEESSTMIREDNVATHRESANKLFAHESPVKTRNKDISKDKIDIVTDKEVTNAFVRGMNNKVDELIKSVIATKELSKHQMKELRQLESLLLDGSLKLKPDKLSKILKLIFRDKGNATVTNSKLVVPKSKWNSEFYVTSSDCKLMSMDITSLYDVVKQNHLDLLIQRKFGSDYSVIEKVKYISTFF